MRFPSLNPAAELVRGDLTGPVASDAGVTGSLAASPLAIVTVVTLWTSSGLVAAYVLGRRGHDFKAVAVLGAVFGPLFIPLARTMTQRDEHFDAIILDRGWPGHGPVDVLVAFDDVVSNDHHGVADVLALLGPRLGRVVLARTVDFQSARDANWCDAKGAAAADLAMRAAALRGYGPTTVLLAGPAATAFARYAAREGHDVLVLAAGWSSAPLRSRRAPAIDGMIVVVPPAPRGIDHSAARRRRAVRPGWLRP